MEHARVTDPSGEVYQYVDHSLYAVLDVHHGTYVPVIDRVTGFPVYLTDKASCLEYLTAYPHARARRFAVVEMNTICGFKIET